jgi:Uma2 family endonuclease
MLMAQTTAVWTLAELDRLPDDGNTYELVDGELFVTPAPSTGHKELATELRYILDPYVRAQRLGRVHTPRSVVQTQGSQVEPDLMVRPVTPTRPQAWSEMPTPSLVVEIVSRTTRRRDNQQKRAFYLRIGVQEYWIVDRETRSIRVVTPRADDTVATTALVWSPTGSTAPLQIDVAAYFDSALGPV